MNSPSKRPLPPSLEDLLRLKKSERPDADFWAEFERGMRQKQLAAIVEPKPWWLGMGLLLRRHASLAGGLSAGVAAMATVLLVGGGGAVSSLPSVAVRTRSQAAVSSAESVAAIGKAEQVLPESAETPGAMSPAKESDSGAPAFLASAPVVPTEREVTSDDAATGARFQFSALLARAASEAADLTTPSAAIPVPSVSEISEMARVAVNEGNSASASNETPASFGEPAATEKPDVVDVVPADPRQARLLAVAADANASALGSLASVRDSVLHRMTDGEAMYASISRLGVSGDRLSLKF